MNTNLLNGAFAPQPTFRDTALISNSQVTLTALGNDLILYPAGSDTPMLRTTLSEPPLCALDCGDTIVVMTESTPRFIHCDSGQWSLLPVPVSEPEVVFRAEPVAPIMASTASIVSTRGTSLTDRLQPGSTLQRKITAALSEAYSSLVASAREGGYFLQPVVARAHFVDSAGATVAVSVPQLVSLSPSEPWQMASPLTTAVTKRTDTDFTIEPFTLSATPWTLHVDFPELTDHPHCCRIAAVRILLSSPVDILDTKSQSPVRFSHTHGNSPGCTAAVPGATIALSPITAHFYERAAKEESASSAYLAATMATDLPTVQIPYPSSPVACSFPRPVPFTARCVTHSGSTVAWGDVRILSSENSVSGKIVTASAADPLIPLGSVSLSPQKISSITPASRSQSTWDFSRTHLYAFTPDGTFAVSFSSRGAYLTAALIDNRPALGPSLFTTHGVYCAVRGGLAIFTGSRAKDFIALPEDIAGLFYRHNDDLILAVSSGGNRFWISPGGEVCRIAPMPEFVYEYTFRSASLPAPCTMILPMLAQQIDAGLSVCADSGVENDAAYPCATASVSGSSLLPLAVRILTKPPRSRLHLRLEGTADASLLINPPFIR